MIGWSVVLVLLIKPVLIIASMISTALKLMDVRLSFNILYVCIIRNGFGKKM